MSSPPPLPSPLTTPPEASRAARRERVLLVNVLAVAVCALVYELLCGTLASYVLGDAVLQFSLVLGTYLFAMGVGAWASRGLERDAAKRYVQAELALALVGGTSSPALLALVGAHVPLRPALYALVFVIGALVGVELPLLVKLLQGEQVAHAASNEGDPSREPRPSGALFGDVVARALAFDYAGALAASLLFPLVLVPRLGLVRTSAVTGAVNALLAFSATYAVRLERPRLLRGGSAVVLGILLVALLRGEAWVANATD